MLRSAVFHNLPIGRRLSLLVFAISAATLMILLYLAIVSATTTLRDESKRLIAQRSAAIAQDLSSRLTRAETLLQTIISASSEASADAATPERISAAVSSVMQYETDLILRSITYADLRPDAEHVLVSYNFPDPSTGRTILTRILDPVALEGEAWQLTLPSADSGWSGPVENILVTPVDTVVTLALSYTDADGSPIGLLWADVSLTTLNRLLRDASTLERYMIPAESSYSLVVNGQDTPIATYNLRSQPPDTTAQRVAALRAEAFAEVIEFPLSSEIAVQSRINGTPWRLISVLNDDLLAGLPTVTSLNLLGIALLGLAVLVGVIALTVRRTVTRPLGQLGRAALEIGSGGLNQVIPYQDRQDEIGQLARTLDTMRADLQHSYDTLEGRIARRTAELDLARSKAQTNAEELRALYDESISVVSDFQLQVILDNFTQRMVTLLKSDYCGVWLTRSTQIEAQLVAHTAPSPVEAVPSRRLGDGLIGRVIESGEPMIVNDYPQWPQRQYESMLTQTAHCLLVVPLIHSGHTIGAALAARFAPDSFFTDNDQRLMSLFTNIVSPSVRNAQLFIQLDAARKDADRANTVKTRFLASVTHELRTPLNLVINNLDFLRVGAFGPVTDEQLGRLTQTIRSAEHLLYLINDLLDVSKIDAGEMKLFIQPTEVPPLLEDVLDSAVVLLEQNDKGARVALTADIPELLPLVPMDGRRIRQVLNNLLSNAIKFTLDGEVNLGVSLSETHLHFSVSDTGIGIPEDEQGALFAPFERTAHASKLGIEGTGLGLPISRHLVQMHGSDLTYQTKVGVGTTFRFALPLLPPRHTGNTRTQLMAVRREDLLDAVSTDIAVPDIHPSEEDTQDVPAVNPDDAPTG